MAKKPKSPQPQQEMVKCNLDNDFSIPKDLEDEIVVFKMTDYSSPVNGDVTKERKFQVTTKRMYENEFVQYFKSNFENDGAFEKVNSAEKIYRIQKNLTKEIVSERWERRIANATKDKTATEKRAYVDNFFESKKKIRLQGSNQIITKFIHVPNLENDKMPEDV